MNTLLVHPATEKQNKALRAVFEALEIPYEEGLEMDETERILSKPFTSEKLSKSIQEAKEGKLTKIALEDLWK